MKPRMTDVVLPPTFEQTASFTPGPWRLAPVSAYAGTDLNIDAGPNGTADYICSAGQRGDPNSEANARLIAACPLLLEALRNFTDGRDIAYTDALVIARDAIAKAGA